MDFAAFRDTMAAAADLQGIVAYVVTVSVALFGVWLASYADVRREQRRRVFVRSN
jgi:hypothetical protein